jgi:hypothetical protein
MQHLPVSDQVEEIIGYFFSTYRITGLVRLMVFVESTRLDSDGATIFNAYLLPENDEARRMFGRTDLLHLQLLHGNYSSKLLNEVFLAEISPLTVDSEKPEIRLLHRESKSQKVPEPAIRQSP